MNYLRTAQTEVWRKVVLLRLDFNTEDEWRMISAIPTIRFLIRAKATVVILSHRGRPRDAKMARGRLVSFEKKFSLRHDARFLSRFLGRPVTFVPHFNFSQIRIETYGAPAGSVFMLENLRFLRGEELDDLRLARAFASLGHAYVNDAFAVSHRDAASIDAITKFLPSYAGLGFEKEITFLSHVMQSPKRPLVVILGGGKAHDKLGVMNYFKRRANAFLLGGAPANTFLALAGVDVKKSLMDEELRDIKKLKPMLRYNNLILPVDWKWDGKKILDVGEKTTARYAKKIQSARTIIWSGPPGFIEKKRFALASEVVARAIAKNKKAFSVAGGGETVMFLKKIGLDKKFSFISTGGGAMLEFLAGKKLPGVEALERNKRKT